MNDVLARLHEMQQRDVPVHGGRTLAYVYDSGLPDVDQVGREAVAAYAGSNGLDPTAFTSLLKRRRRSTMASISAATFASRQTSPLSSTTQIDTDRSDTSIPV